MLSITEERRNQRIKEAIDRFNEWLKSASKDEAREYLQRILDSTKYDPNVRIG